MEDYTAVYSYLENNEYPEGLTKDGKRNWRRRCCENFKIENGQLFHRKCDRKKKEQEQQEPNQSEWKRCIKTNEEKDRIFRSCHSSDTGTWAH